MTGFTVKAATGHACNCMGPQNGEPLCPCRMRNVIQRDGRWIERERDLGAVRPQPATQFLASRGCVCPPGAEATCQGPLCPRKPIGPASCAAGFPSASAGSPERRDPERGSIAEGDNIAVGEADAPKPNDNNEITAALAANPERRG